ncbi:MAG: hypothetical protein D6808_06060, partial [Candidatus Dadabacteria bacterium]
MQRHLEEDLSAFSFAYSSIVFLSFLSLLIWSLLQTTKGLMLDETGTWWAVKESLTDAAGRARAIHSQSFLSYGFFWLSWHLLGKSNFLFRFPSIIISLLSLIFLHKINQELFGKRYPLGLEVFFFLLFEPLSIKFIYSARPYPFALFFSITSVYSCIRYVKTKNIN